jgi:hypothetical protein
VWIRFVTLLPERVVECDPDEVSAVWLHVEPSVLTQRERALVSY